LFAVAVLAVLASHVPAVVRHAPATGFPEQTAKDAVSAAVIRAAIEVHRTLGPGLLESAYQRCLACELDAAAIPYREQVAVPLRYRALHIATAYRLDMVVAESVVVEVKSVDRITRGHEAQVLTYMRLCGLPVGLVLNFGAVRLVDGIRRLMRPLAAPTSATGTR
jgi:GxxExxY protein